MANIFTSSIGKKLIMSISGLFLIVFMCVHAFVNGLSLISAEAFNAGCEFMALPVISVMVPVLAAGFIVHIVYAFVLNCMNYKARGTQRYAVPNKAQTDDWASKNMLVLGIIVLGVLGFHLSHFWAKMQLPMFLGKEYTHDGAALLALTFKQWWVVALYIVWFVALWLHMNHGFWSAFHTIGLNNNIWMKRLKNTGIVVSTIIVLVFIAVAIKGYLVANGMCCC